jgi:hypothetical protein
MGWGLVIRLVSINIPSLRDFEEPIASMHIAIDDTYGPDTATGSRYVTDQRRTHVAVIFPDEEVEEYRSQIRGCLEEVGTCFKSPSRVSLQQNIQSSLPLE